jgi:hypothetical protein
MVGTNVTRSVSRSTGAPPPTGSHESVYVVSFKMAADVTALDDAGLHDSPLVPSTVHVLAYKTFQERFTVVPRRTLLLEMVRVPLGSPFPQRPSVSLQMYPALHVVVATVHQASVWMLSVWSSEQLFATGHGEVKVTR